MSIDEFARGITERVMERAPDVRAEYRHTAGGSAQVTLKRGTDKLTRKITAGSYLGCTTGGHGPMWVRQLAGEYLRDLGNATRRDRKGPEEQGTLW